MASSTGAPGTSDPPSAPDPSKDNTLRAPFPRTNTTVKPSPSTRRPSSIVTSSAKPNPVARKDLSRRTMPSNNIPGPRRNERFDHLFYTSPLPRSISRAYNSLQAAAPTTTGARTAELSALRMGVMTDGVNGDSTMSQPRKIPGGAARTVARRKVVATDGAALGDPALVVARKTQAPPVPPVDASVLQSTSLTGSSAGAVADKSVSAGKPALLVQDDAAVSSEKQRDGLARKEPGNEATPKGDVLVKVLIQTVKKGNKRSGPDPPPPTLPRKIPRAAASSSPGQVRSTQGVKSRTPPVGVQTNIKPGPKQKAKRSFPKNVVETQKQPEPSSSLLRSQNQSNSLATEPSQPSPPVTAPKRERNMAIKVRTGFEVPPGILDETGSLWDSVTGRRLSRRVSIGLLSSPRPASAPASAQKQDSKNNVKEKQLPSESRRNEPAMAPFSVGSKEVGKEQRPRPSISSSEQVKRSTRSSLGSIGKDVRWIFADKSTSPEEETTPAPRTLTRSPYTGNKNEKPEIHYSKHGKSLEKKIITPSKQQHNSPSVKTPIPPPTPPPLPLRKPRRSIRNSTDLTGQQTPPIGPRVSAATTLPVIKKGVTGSWVVEGTPQPELTWVDNHKGVAKATGLKSSVNLEFEFSDDDR